MKTSYLRKKLLTARITDINDQVSELMDRVRRLEKLRSYYQEKISINDALTKYSDTHWADKYSTLSWSEIANESFKEGVEYGISQYKESLTEEIPKILEGIDSDDDEIGWWETSMGARFGKTKLAELMGLINKNE